MDISRYQFIVEDNWPETVNDAADWLIERTDEKDKQYIRSLESKDEMVQFHFNVGMWIRNNFGLWKGNDKLLHDSGHEHPDDASGVILERVWEKIQAMPL